MTDEEMVNTALPCQGCFDPRRDPKGLHRTYCPAYHHPTVLALLIKQRREVYVEACVAVADAIRRNRIARGNYSSNWEQGFSDGLKWAEDDALMIPVKDATTP